jgi:hypothetical protein
MSHAALPRLCLSCHAALLELASTDPRPFLARWCASNRTMAYGFKRGSASISHWELHLVPTDRELTQLHSERLAELFLSGQLARPVTS